MYPSRGGRGYGQQQYTPQQGYGQGAASSCRSHPSLESHYGGQYSSVYGTSNANISQQASGMGSKVAVTSSVHGCSGYGSGLGDPPAVMPSSLGSSLGVQTDEYLPSSKYGHNSDHYASMKSDYASGERHHYADHLAPYMGRDLKTDLGRRYSESVGLSHQHVSEIQEQMDQASLLRQQQLLKAPSLQITSDLRMPLATSSFDGSSRQTDYLAARAAAIRNSQDISSYGRIASDPCNFPVLGNAYVDSQPPSLLGSAFRRNMDDILHGQGPVGGVYGVGLPPGRDYAASKGLHGSSIDSDYAGCVLSTTVRSKSDDHNDERSIFRHKLEIRELDRRREHMHLHKRDKERDREREREQREHERERERDRERERERERERVRERDRLRRELERERECKRSIERRRERTPATNTRDHRSSSLVKDERPARKEPLPINDVSHRRYFPVRGKRKEYVCKVLPHSLIDFERDYTSISERYPRLSISPEFSKVVAYWLKSDLVLSIHTPASFEHELIEECNNTERNLSVKTLAGKPESSNSITTVWNVKVLLMSGISAEAFAELCADNNVDDRIPHFNSILRFAILRKDRTLMAIGGRWEDAIDGGDPCVEDSALIRAALRYAKDLTQVDLSKCQCWNRFLEIHYDRVGKDGFFSHKEITVLFVPNLSACLPSMDAWRSDWYAVKTTKAESEQRQMSQKEKRMNNAEDQKGETSQIKCGKNAEAAKSSRAERKNVCEGKKIAPMVGDMGNDVKSMRKKLQDDSKDGEDEKKVCQVEAKTNGEEFVFGTPKIVKRNIVKKVKKIKVGCGRKGETEINTIVKDETGEGSVEEGAKQVESQGASGTVGSEDCKLEGVSEKPSRSRKIFRKIAKGKVVHKESKDAEDKKSDEAQNESKVPEIAAASGEPNSVVKRTMKRKIIRKVVARKKTPEGEDDLKVVEKNQVNEGNGTMDDNTNVPKPLQEQDALVECVASRQDIKIDDESSSAPKKKGDFGKRTTSATTTVDMKEKMKSESKDVHMKVSKLLQEQDTVVECGTNTKDIKIGEEGKGASKMKGDSGKRTTSATITVDMKEKVKPETKNDMSEQRSSRSSKEGQKFEEPPVHPGFFLQTKWTKESKLRSLSLSLDALLDYNEKDFEESTFELSLFAESMYEMLQYQMGSRILEFLEKLRLKFITRRSLKRKEKGEIADKDGDGEKQPKRLKHSDDSLVVMEPSVKLEASDGTKIKESTLTVSEEKLLPVDNSKTGDIEEEPEEDPEEEEPEEDPEEEEPEEDPEEEEPEEDPEEDVSEDPEDTGDGNIEDASEEEKNDCEEAILQDGVDKVRGAIWDKLISWGEGTDNKDEKDKDVNADKKTHVCQGDDLIQKKTDTVKEPAVVNELLQAFRFFDRNRVGYLKVEDLRLIIHNLGKFLSHGDVKELVQSALLESSAGRNNRILYHKLVGQS